MDIDDLKPGEESAPDVVTAETTNDDPGDQPPPENAENSPEPGDPGDGDPGDDAQAASQAAQTLSKRTDAERDKKQTFQERINDITRARRDAERERDRLRERLSRYEDLSKEPDPATYDDYEKLESDRAASNAARLRKMETEQDIADAESRAQAARLEEWAGRVEDFKERAPDFDQKVFGNPRLNITESMVEILTESEHGPQVAYHLANNPGEADRIAKLSERAQAVEIGKIEGRINAAPVRRTTKAPNPVPTVSGGNPGGVPDFDKMSAKEYAAYQNEQERKRLEARGGR